LGVKLEKLLENYKKRINKDTKKANKAKKLIQKQIQKQLKNKKGRVGSKKAKFLEEEELNDLSLEI